MRLAPLKPSSIADLDNGTSLQTLFTHGSTGLIAQVEAAHQVKVDIRVSDKKVKVFVVGAAADAGASRMVVDVEGEEVV